MTANMSTNLYDRLANDTGVPRHAIKKVLYRLAYDGELVTDPPGPEEFVLRAGLGIAQRGAAQKALADWLLEYSDVVQREQQPLRPKAAYDIAGVLIDGGVSAVAVREDYRKVVKQCADLRETLADIQAQIESALQDGGA